MLKQTHLSSIKLFLLMGFIGAVGFGLRRMICDGNLIDGWLMLCLLVSGVLLLAFIFLLLIRKIFDIKWANSLLGWILLGILGFFCFGFFGLAGASDNCPSMKVDNFESWLLEVF